jgi:hypothetical protein
MQHHPQMLRKDYTNEFHVSHNYPEWTVDKILGVDEQCLFGRSASNVRSSDRRNEKPTTKFGKPDPTITIT